MSRRLSFVFALPGNHVRSVWGAAYAPMEIPVVLLIILIALKISTAPLVAFRATWESITVLVVRKEGEDAHCQVDFDDCPIFGISYRDTVR